MGTGFLNERKAIFVLGGIEYMTSSILYNHLHNIKFLVKLDGCKLFSCIFLNFHYFLVYICRGFVPLHFLPSGSRPRPSELLEFMLLPNHHYDNEYPDQGQDLAMML